MKDKWTTVLIHRSYPIKTFDGAKFDFNYIIDDPAFLPDYKRYKTVQEAMDAIDKETL